MLPATTTGQPAARDPAALRTAMTALIREQMATHNTVGLSIALIDDQKLVWAEGFGHADRERNLAARADTLYSVGGITQLFTAAATLQLADQGAIRLDDPVRKYLPEFSMRSGFANAAPITARHLLSHHAGLPAMHFRDMWTPRPEPLAAFVARLKDEYVAFPPGQVSVPSFPGYGVLGRMIEAQCGQPYARCVQSKLLAPLAMRGSTFDFDRIPATRRAMHYWQGKPIPSQTVRDVPAAAEVARDATQAPTLDELLGRAARLVLDRFAVDDVGIYLLDEKRQFAVLQSAPTEFGQAMLSASYRVPVGHPNAVGQAAETGEAQLAVEGGSGGMQIGDEYHTTTRSQLTLPLRTNEGTIGLLDLQSDAPDFFTPADATTIQVLADQLAAAVERGRLLVEVQQRLAQLEQSYRRFTEDSWEAYGRTGSRLLGYRDDNIRLEPQTALPEDAQQAMSANSTITMDAGDGAPGSSPKVHVPIRLRGHSLGVMTLSFRGGRPPARTLALLEQAADRLGTALENVRLLEDSLRRASKDGLIDRAWEDWLEAPHIRATVKDGQPATRLTVQFEDQARLIGLLRQLHGMGLELLSVTRVGKQS